MRSYSSSGSFVWSHITPTLPGPIVKTLSAIRTFEIPEDLCRMAAMRPLSGDPASPVSSKESPPKREGGAGALKPENHLPRTTELDLMLSGQREVAEAAFTPHTRTAEHMEKTRRRTQPRGHTFAVNS